MIFKTYNWYYFNIIYFDILEMILFLLFWIYIEKKNIYYKYFVF